ncbi:MAG: LPS-assembly protein LptD [Acidobacteria bacterium]|nr:LPS-assembly protein LptD [Acidobacteriota bacterium]
MKVVKVCLAFCCVTRVLGQTTGSQSQPAVPPPEPTLPATVPKIAAGYQEKGPQFIVARNYVDFTYEKYRLQCDVLTYEVRTQEILAEGNVILEDGVQRLAGEKLRFSLKTKRGVMFEASGTAAPDLRFVADETEKYDEGMYRARHGEFTSCTQPNPRWGISAARAELEVDDHLTLRGATFKVKSVPVFYLPYMSYPIDDDNRQTGFLLPGYGHSSVKGTILGEAFFWAINRSQDATLAYRSFSKAGRGFEGEYRYIFPDGSSGTANFFYLFGTPEKTETDAGADSARFDGYYLDFGHQQILPWGVSNRTDVTILTSYGMRTIVSSNFQQFSSPIKSSSTQFSKSAGYDSVSLQVRRDEVLTGSEAVTVKVGKKGQKVEKVVGFIEKSNVATYVPDARFNHNQQRLGSTPLLVSGSANVIGYDEEYRVLNTAKHTLVPTPLVEYRRLSWEQTVAVPLTSLAWLTFNPSATYSGSYWSDSYLPGTQSQGGGPLLRNTFATQVKLNGPSFNRIFSTPDWAFSQKWKHSVEPFFQLDYNTKFQDASRVIEKARDSIGSGDLRSIAYSLTNTLYAKRPTAPGLDPAPVDILRWTVKQSYQPNPARADARRFSDINSQLTFRIAPVVDLTFGTDYDVYAARFADYQVRGRFSKADAFSLGIGWTFGRNRDTWEAADEGVTADGGFNLKRLGLRLDGSLAYSPLEGTKKPELLPTDPGLAGLAVSPLEETKKLQSATLRWSESFQCWGFEVLYQRQLLRDLRKTDEAFYLTMHIGAIGTISEKIGGSRF